MAPSRPARSRPRVVDVAALAGVSPQTVSNVINQRGGFTDETRARVESAIEQLGFQPNRYAQSLRWHRTMLLGFDMSGQQLDVTNPFTVNFLRSLVRAADAQGYGVVAFTHEEGEDKFRASIAARPVDGFVLSDAPAEDVRARVLHAARIPFVVFGRTAPDLPQSWVDIDNHAAMAPVVDRLVAAGHQRFGWIGYSHHEYWNRDRFDGARDRLAHHGLAFDPGAVLVGDRDDLRGGVREYLARRPRPTAVITSSDSLAVRVVNAAGALGLRVGADLAVTGFDAGPLRDMVEPSLTSVRIPVDRIAVALVDRLLAHVLEGRPGTGEIVPTELVVGESA